MQAESHHSPRSASATGQGAATAPALRAAVYDPSCRRDGSYWQWSTVQTDPAWDHAMLACHGGWPVRTASLPISAVLYGVQDDGRGDLWLYRVFPAGRDSFGRPGRYVVAIFSLRTPDQALDPRVAGILRYLEQERGLPLNLEPLRGKSLPEAAPDSTLVAVHERWSRGDTPSNHWGMDATGTIVPFGPPRHRAPRIETRPPAAPPAPADVATPRRHETPPAPKATISAPRRPYETEQRAPNQAWRRSEPSRCGGCGSGCLVALLAAMAMAFLLLNVIRGCRAYSKDTLGSQSPKRTSPIENAMPRNAYPADQAVKDPDDATGGEAQTAGSAVVSDTAETTDVARDTAEKPAPTDPSSQDGGQLPPPSREDAP